MRKTRVYSQVFLDDLANANDLPHHQSQTFSRSPGSKQQSFGLDGMYDHNNTHTII